MEYIGIIETEDRGVYSVIKDGDHIIAGMACNAGIMPQYETIKEQDQTLDQALEVLYNKIISE